MHENMKHVQELIDGKKDFNAGIEKIIKDLRGFASDYFSTKNSCLIGKLVISLLNSVKLWLKTIIMSTFTSLCF